MSTESKFFTVNHITEDVEGNKVITHTDYTAEQKNDAVIKFHELAKYARELNTIVYFRTSITNEWNGEEMVDTDTKEVEIEPIEEITE